MKRNVPLLLAFVLCLSLPGCSGTSEQANGPKNDTVSSGNSSNYIDASISSRLDNEGFSDDNGIPGMKAFSIRAVLESEPFCIPMTDDVPAPAEAADIYAASCTSSGSGNKGVLYDYSITMDGDGEIIGASFGIVSTTASQKELLTAADLYFYTVSIISYDTSDKETLTSWFEENLSAASDTATEIIIGDARFELYGIPEVMYWVDISKVA